ncbi:hypothetical protein [Loigolactobacillus backii]|uniref:Uncharacterized protein n=1 Tax=Loigolactobacillus backii TaxID=375175 RepID=A0A192H487_9LACO|nr:hypothetical protein [Loigolactobacillus backii]ANK59392.1 hypothetical protein AYR52_03500 [Loigolactobacillus backii]ANK63032.1 hypothetical protein AYR53_09825 [Loigolactobacillus backii]ANK67219.1 hypothetical protein AYR55_05530 [Loigolactobacillus backii]ANK69960.1 hypothetical protein AYR56_07180 [Loigolactobacillus backii]MDA5388339.1 hypothetical protein [Loigolactobacillus backii]
MVPVIIYWGSVILLAVWLVWNVLFSIKFLASGERGNLWGFMLLNIFALIFGILVQWAFADNGFIKWALASSSQKVVQTPWLYINNWINVALIVLQFFLGWIRSPKTAK